MTLDMKLVAAPSWRLAGQTINRLVREPAKRLACGKKQHHAAEARLDRLARKGMAVRTFHPPAAEELVS